MAQPDKRLAPSSPELLTATAVARRLGVAVDTLRTWDRRYGIGPSDRAEGTRRRYLPADVDRLQRMRNLVAEGMPSAAAARAVTASAAEQPTADSPTGAARFGGGRTLAVPRGTPDQRGLARAAAALDVDAVERLLVRAIAQRGTVSTWDDLLRPVLASLGRRWESTGDAVEIEHLLSQTAIDVLRETARQQQARTNVPVLAASVESDAHTLPLYALAAALGELGVPVRVAGASTPHQALRAAADRIGPSGIFLWSQIPDSTPDPTS